MTRSTLASAYATTEAILALLETAVQEVFFMDLDADQERIRLKRIQKLQAQAQTQPPTQVQAQPQQSQPVQPKPVEKVAVHKPSTPQKSEEELTIESILQVSFTPHSDYFQLSLLAQELKQESIPTVLSLDILERVLVSRLSHGTDGMNYLISCFERCKNAPNKIQDLLVGYIVLLVLVPDSFPSNDPLATLTSYLVSSQNTTLIEELLKSDDYAGIFEPIILQLMNEFRMMTIQSRFLNHLNLFLLFSEYKPLAIIMTDLIKEVPVNLMGKQFELASFLGPLFRLNVFGLELQIPEIESMRQVVSGYQMLLSRFMLNLLKKGERKKVLLWLKQALTFNYDRSKMQFDALKVASDGFMNNLTRVLLRLSEPVKLELVDLDFVTVVNPNYTRFNVTQQEIVPVEKEYNFVTEIFHLTLESVHLGPVKSFQLFVDLLKDTRDTQQSVERFRNSTNPLYNQLVGRLEDHLRKLMNKRVAFECQLLNPEYLEAIGDFQALALRYLAKSGRFTPEFYVEDISEIYLDYFRFNPKYIKNVDLFVNLLIHLLNSKINVYLLSKQVEVLYVFIQEVKNIDFYLLKKELFHDLTFGLVKLYIEIEKTGVSSQFYDKFGIRYNLSQIFKYMWKFNEYKNTFVELSKQDLFVKFVNLLMNDATWLLDEGLSKLREIHAIQTSGEIDEEKQKRLDELERACKSFIQLINETVFTLSYLTQIQAPFLRAEIIDRLAAMLNYNLDILVNKCQELKVQNPEKYSFQPRQLLNDITTVYLNLATKEFYLAVVRDGRSFSMKVFYGAVGILERRAVKSVEEINRFKVYIQHLEEAFQSDRQAEEELGEIPDEFLDPLLFTLMEDPVILPSKVTVDRATIVSHLLSDPTDPFNRQPLKIEDVKDDTEMKAKIEEWKRSRKNKAL